MATKEELKARAEELGLEVEGQEGKAPTVADYEAALEAKGAGIPATIEGDEEGEQKTFVVKGPFRVFGQPRGSEVTGTVKSHTDTGDELLIVGAEYAVLGPLLEAGWLEEKGA